MKGDFSRWDFDERDNAAGVLQQQGRVLTDTDWNQQTRLTDRWQTRSAQGTFGARVAAVAEAVKESFLVTEASVTAGGEVTIAVMTGEVWADGLLAYLRASDAAGVPELRRAVHLQAPPANAPAGSAGSRDVVVLELIREAVNGFQVPHRMIESALGGVDTTERLWHGLTFRLLRLVPGEDCEDVLDRLADDLSARGRLTVELAPTTIQNGECPVVVGGGYTGFEHNLYRVEVARVDSGGPFFKWSQFNGGLVGRGTFDAATSKVKIRANRQPILRSGLQSFYLEAYEPHPARPPQPASPDLRTTAALAEEWRLVYGGRAVLASDEEIDLTETLFGAVPGPKEQRFFFRLWNEIRPVADFTGGTPTELRDGIRLAFQAGDDFRPDDYWTFPVRAGGVDDSQTLIDDRPPEGPRRSRVPLAILEWSGGATITRAAGEIEDCRKVFPPLTDLPPGCCIAVEPGADLARLVEKLVKAGGGCLCLLPGEHLLKRPVDLRGAAHVKIQGFGLASRLVVEEKLLGSAPLFDLTGAAGVTFESFAIVNRGPAPVFFANATRDLTVEGMFVAASFSARSIFEIGDMTSRGWRIEDNVLLGRAGLTGLRLSHSTIAGNEFAGLTSGIRFSDLLDVVVERNRFLGLPVATAQELDEIFAAGGTGDGPIGKVLSSFAPRFDAMETGGLSTASAGATLLDGLELAARRDARSRYVAIRASGLFDVVVAGNRMLGRIGILGEIVENVVVEDNRILTTLAGAALGLVHSLRFTHNQIGEERVNAQIVHLAPRVGLKVQGDAIDCRIEGNAFLDVRDAIVFESDLDGGKDIVRAAEADLRLVGPVDEGESVEIVKAAKEEVGGLRTETRLLASTYFRLGQSKRTFIEGNVIQADGVGIEWSGTKDIVDFRVSRNAFLGCRNGAVLIEPDDRVYYVHLAEPVDTKVRLIDHNRFDVSGVAVRSTIGALRVEKNDIRIRAPRLSFLPTVDFVGLMTAEVFKLSAFADAAKEKDFGNVRLRSKEALFTASSNPGSIDTRSFFTKAENRILAGREVAGDDALTDSVFLLSRLALADDAPLLVAGAGALLNPVLANLEGFVVNLSGIQNEVVDNNLLSRNNDLDGGVLLHMPSGMVSGNEVQVGRLGVMVSSKAGQGRYDLKVEGNKVRVTGPPRGDGKRLAAYALAVPTLTPGNYAILDNHLDGSVMLGAEPFSSSGLFKKGTLDIGNFVFFNHALAFDGSTYFKALSKAGEAAKETSATIINAEIVHAVLTGFFADLFDMDPHKSRAVIQFADNRVVRGYVALARSTAGAFWTVKDLKKQASAAPIIEVNGNVFDYWARIVGRDVILVGNHSQTPILYRVGREVKEVANIPAPVSF